VFGGERKKKDRKGILNFLEVQEVSTDNKGLARTLNPIYLCLGLGALQIFVRVKSPVAARLDSAVKRAEPKSFIIVSFMSFGVERPLRYRLCFDQNDSCIVG